ncbi:hypothetical protein ACW2QC_09255 [Virgibacillus sp. FSP13]
MKTADALEPLKRASIIKQLAELGITDVDDLTYRELKVKLVVEQYKAVDVENSNEAWF